MSSYHPAGEVSSGQGVDYTSDQIVDASISAKKRNSGQSVDKPTDQSLDPNDSAKDNHLAAGSTDTDQSEQKKVQPVAGIPPHLWHKQPINIGVSMPSHTASSNEADDVTNEQRGEASQTPNAKETGAWTSSGKRHITFPTWNASPQADVSYKQWMRTSNEPRTRDACLRRKPIRRRSWEERAEAEAEAENHDPHAAAKTTDIVTTDEHNSGRRVDHSYEQRVDADSVKDIHDAARSTDADQSERKETQTLPGDDKEIGNAGNAPGPGNEPEPENAPEPEPANKGGSARAISASSWNETLMTPNWPPSKGRNCNGEVYPLINLDQADEQTTVGHSGYSPPVNNPTREHVRQMKKNKWDTWDHVRGGRLPALPESFQPAVPITRFFNIANSESEPEIQGIFIDPVVGSAGGGAPLAARESKDVLRSDKNCAGSNVGLPSVPSLVISNAGEDEARAKTIKPINNNWNNVSPDDGLQFQTDSQIGVFVRDWVKLTPDNVVATFSRQGNDMHHKSDIDTFTGQLLSPILYPDSIVDVSRIDPALDWRRQNWTSNLLIRRPANISGLSSLTGPLRPLGQPAEPKSQKQGTGQRGRILARAGYGPRIPCHLRPAQPKDMEEVTDIYNWEVMGGIQALDTSALPITALQDVLELTQKLGMPFIVAVSGPARKVQLGSNINPYAQYPQYNADVQNQTDTVAEEKVLGFGYFSIWQPGLAGAGNGSSRATARVNLFVDSEHRRNNIGSSILHALLRTVSHQFPAGAEYEFVNPARSPVYSRPLEHERKYYQIYINYVVKHDFDGRDTGDDDNLKWVRTLLEDRFGFVEKARLECTHVTAKRPSHPPFWLDTVIFEHSCHPDPRDSRIMPKK